MLRRGAEEFEESPASFAGGILDVRQDDE